jgi:hypothetical protein
MAATGVAPISVSLEGVHEPGKVPTTALLAAMLRASEKVSDLIFSPGRPPQVEVYGQLVPVQMEGLSALSADDTRRIAADLIGNNKQAINTLPSGPGALSRECLYPAGKLRSGHARDSNRDSGI